MGVLVGKLFHRLLFIVYTFILCANRLSCQSILLFLWGAGKTRSQNLPIFQVENAAEQVTLNIRLLAALQGAVGGERNMGSVAGSVTNYTNLLSGLSSI